MKGKKQETILIEKFELKTELKILKALNSILTIPDDSLINTKSEHDILKSEVIVMNVENTILIVGKSDKAKLLLARFCDIDKIKIDKKPDLIFKTKKEIHGLYALDYLNLAFKLFKATDTNRESVLLNMGSDYPLMVSNEHFDFILAPRVENDEF